MIRPPFLEKGDTIYLVAPSFGCTEEPYLTRLEVSLKKWKNKGYKVIEGKNIRKAEGVAASASPKERAEEILEAFSSEAKAVISVGGGELMNEMLGELDFDALRKLPPKWFMGFSDNTNLTFLLTTKLGWMSIYGPCFPQFFQKKWRLSEADGFALLHGATHLVGYPKYSITRRNENPLISYRCTQMKIITAVDYEKPLIGTLLGGCMDILQMYPGTSFDDVLKFNQEHPEGIIWYLEACDLNPLDIRRALWRFKEAGWFENAKGFLFGRPRNGRYELLGVDRFNAVIDVLKPLGKPILLDVDLGHVSPSLPIVNGAKAKVALEEGNIIFDYLYE